MTFCSDTSRALDEPLAGTAPVAASWIVLEQPGPWGPTALTTSHLDPAIGGALGKAASAHGARAALVRRPGRHPDIDEPASRRLWVASTRPGASWLLGGWITDVYGLGELDWHSVERGDRDGVRRSLPALRPETDPLLLICTNGKRDVCCATRGRLLVTSLRDRIIGRVWETTHLGGHRFAPTGVLLPYGATYGQLTTETAIAIMDQARLGRFVAGGYRGRSTFAPAGQVAEAAVRRLCPEAGLDDLDVPAVRPVETGGAWRVLVHHRDGRRWDVPVRAQALEPARQQSCGAAVTSPPAYVAGEPSIGE